MCFITAGPIPSSARPRQIQVQVEGYWLGPPQHILFGPTTEFNRHSLLCTYCTNSRSRGKNQAKNKRQSRFSNPCQQNAVRATAAGMRCRGDRHCRVLNATAPICDNFVWLPRACVPGGVRSKKVIRTSLFLSDCARQRARSTRFHTQRRSGSLFPWQSLAWELIPSGSRPNN